MSLFNRSQRRVELTPAGKALRVRAVRILKEIDKATDEARQIGSQAPPARLRIGFIHSSSLACCLRSLRGFRVRRPAVVLELAEMTMLELVRALRTGDIDIAVMRTLGDCPDITFETIVHEPLLPRRRHRPPLPAAAAFPCANCRASR